MGYRINEKKDSLYNDTHPLFKAANDVGKKVLEEILKHSLGREHVKVPLHYVAKQKVWVDARERYVLFDIGTTEHPEIIQAYLEGAEQPSDLPAGNVDGILATDGALPIAIGSGEVLDVPMQAKVMKRQADIDKAVNPDK